MHKWFLIFLITLNVVIAVAPSAWRFYINGRAGCWPWSPAEVDYSEGMTLCPGQSARMRVPFQIAPVRRESPEI